MLAVLQNQIPLIMKTIICIGSIVFFILLSGAAISQTTISIRLGPATGQDCNLASYIPDTPLPSYPDIVSASWTYQSEFNLWRPLFRFNLNEIPQNSHIISAKLTLYANPNPVSAPHSGANKSYIRKVTSPWDENTVTWETQPDFSTVNQVVLPQSVSPSQDYPDLDVTALVREMAANPSENFGFIIMNRIENTYRSINFASSECIDVNKRPKLDVTYSAVGIEPVSSTIPDKFSLSQNFPNPFNPVTNISFEIPFSSFVKLNIYNELGNEVSVLVNEKLRAGKFEVQWDGSNFSSGTYFIKLQSDKNLLTKKMVLLK